MSRINSFSFYKEYYEIINELKQKDKKELAVAILDYMFDDIEPKFKGLNKAIFDNLKRPLTKSKIKSMNSQNENETKTKLKQNENEIETELKQNKNKTTNTSDVNVNVIVNKNINNKDLEDIINYYIKNINNLIGNLEYQKLEYWQKVFSCEVIKYAIDIAVMRKAKNISYIEAILNNWNNASYKTLEDIKESEEKIKKKKNIAPEEIFDYDWLNESVEGIV